MSLNDLLFSTVRLVGNPYHGAIHDGLLHLPNGATLPRVQPSGGDCFALSVPGTPAVQRTAEELAQDAGMGMQWFNHAYLYGDSSSSDGLLLYGVGLGPQSWIYATASARWLCDASDLAVSGGALSGTLHVSRFGDFSHAAETYDLALSLGVDCGDCQLLRIHAIKPDGSGVLLGLYPEAAVVIPTASSAGIINMTERPGPLNVVEIVIADAPWSAQAYMVYSRADCAPDGVRTEDDNAAPTSAVCTLTVDETYNGLCVYFDENYMPGYIEPGWYQYDTINGVQYPLPCETCYVLDPETETMVPRPNVENFCHLSGSTWISNTYCACHVEPGDTVVVASDILDTGDYTETWTYHRLLDAYYDAEGVIVPVVAEIGMTGAYTYLTTYDPALPAAADGCTAVPNRQNMLASITHSVAILDGLSARTPILAAVTSISGYRGRNVNTHNATLTTVLQVGAEEIEIAQWSVTNGTNWAAPFFSMRNVDPNTSPGAADKADRMRITDLPGDDLRLIWHRRASRCLALDAYLGDHSASPYLRGVVIVAGSSLAETVNAPASAEPTTNEASYDPAQDVLSLIVQKNVCQS